MLLARNNSTVRLERKDGRSSIKNLVHKGDNHRVLLDFSSLREIRMIGKSLISDTNHTCARFSTDVRGVGKLEKRISRWM